MAQMEQREFWAQRKSRALAPKSRGASAARERSASPPGDGSKEAGTQRGGDDGEGVLRARKKKKKKKKGRKVHTKKNKKDSKKGKHKHKRKHRRKHLGSASDSDSSSGFDSDSDPDDLPSVKSSA